MPSKYLHLCKILQELGLNQGLPNAVQDLELSAVSLISRLDDKGSLLVVCANSARLDHLRDDLNLLMKVLGDDRPLLTYAEMLSGRDEFLPEAEAARDRTLNVLVEDCRAVVLTTPAAILPEVLTPKALLRSKLKLAVGEERFSPETLCEMLVELDYDNELQVNIPGEFSKRGGLVDIFSPVYETAFRIEFFGDEIDSIRTFDPDTQRSLEEVDSFFVTPCRGASFDHGSFFEYLPNSRQVLLDAVEVDMHIETYFTDENKVRWQELGKTLNFERVEISPEAAFDLFPAKALSPYYKSTIPEAFDEAQLMHGQFLEQQLRRWQDSGYKVFAFCGSVANSRRFEELVGQFGFDMSSVEIFNDDLQYGFMLPRQGAVVLSESEIFGRAIKRETTKKPRYSLQSILEAEPDFSVGDAVVHESYGIALFQGIRLERNEEQLREVMELEFADDRTLLIPLDQIHLISRYIGSGGNKAKLSRLTGSAWQKACEKAEDAARDFAADILRLQAMRKACEVQAYGPDTEWQKDFEEAFPYQETEDQLKAIKEIKGDLESSRPMDRLLCGDVGFGKTEVAMRAAFKAVMEGRQVAIVVPTTVLAQQHGQTFSGRMADYPIRIEVLSRLVTKRKQKAVLEAVALGQVDIVIGTHRLLQGDVVFDNLGLAVIDEEQRFGVTAKEKLKELRATVDILTMTATPIPRTLYFSLSGLRDLSTIMTPPRERKPVKTVVSRYDDTVIRNAVLRELERGGQVYFLHNRVQTIEKVCGHLKKLIPEARFSVGHGQMGEGALESTMARFVDGEIDVFVCTTIVESGLDVPNANTMIIERSDMFGLSELYQLRGRVGRYHQQAYCYLFLPLSGTIQANARERLSALKRYTHLGSGFKLALRDLEIRGAGNILGAEQSGFIASVGFDLYCSLLRDATARLENKPVEKRPEISIKIDFISHSLEDKGRIAACIPESFIVSETVRLEFYRRLSLAKSDNEISDLEEELCDRFGKLPEEVQWFFRMVRLKLMAAQKGIYSIRTQGGKLLIESDEGLWKSAGALPLIKGKEPAEKMSFIESYVFSIKQHFLKPQ